MIFENAAASTPVWEVDNDNGDFRWYTPGFVAMKLTKAGNAVAQSLYDNNVEKVKINTAGNSFFTGGNVGIGTTTPLSTLTVVGTTTTTGLEVTGDAYNTAGTWSVFSDERLKSEVNTYTRGLDLITKIKTHTFKYNELSGNDTTKTHVGIIAQELAPLAPEMFTTLSKKINGQATDVYVYNGGTDLIYALINAIQEINNKLTGTYNDALVWVKSLKADKVETKMLCVEDVCVTKEQFLRMVQQSGGQSSPVSAPTTPVAPTETTSTPSEVITDPAPVVETPIAEPVPVEVPVTEVPVTE